MSFCCIVGDSLVAGRLPPSVLAAVKAGKEVILPPMKQRPAPRMLQMALGPMASVGCVFAADELPSASPNRPSDAPNIGRGGPTSLIVSSLSLDQIEQIVDGAVMRCNGCTETPAQKTGTAIVMVRERMVQIDGLDEAAVTAAIEGQPVAFTPERITEPRW